MLRASYPQRELGPYLVWTCADHYAVTILQLDSEFEHPGFRYQPVGKV
jgi:hypothetical protein